MSRDRLITDKLRSYPAARRNPRLVALLLEEQVLGHPFVIGELACGSMKRRGEILGLLQHLPQIAAVAHRRCWCSSNAVR